MVGTPGTLGTNQATQNHFCRAHPANEPPKKVTKPVQTLEKPKTTKRTVELSDQHKRAMKGVGATKPTPAKGPHTLAEAKLRLAELQRAGAKLAIQLPPAEIPKTLDSARRLIADLEQRLASALATPKMIAPQLTEPIAPSGVVDEPVTPAETAARLRSQIRATTDLLEQTKLRRQLQQIEKQLALAIYRDPVALAQHRRELK